MSRRECSIARWRWTIARWRWTIARWRWTIARWRWTIARWRGGAETAAYRRCAVRPSRLIRGGRRIKWPWRPTPHFPSRKLTRIEDLFVFIVALVLIADAPIVRPAPDQGAGDGDDRAGYRTEHYTANSEECQAGGNCCAGGMVEGRLQRGVRGKHDVDDQAEYRGNHVGDPARPHPPGDGAELARRKKTRQPKRDDL